MKSVLSLLVFSVVISFSTYAKVSKDTISSNESQKEQTFSELTEKSGSYTVIPLVWDDGSFELTESAKSIIDKELLSVAMQQKYAVIELGVHTDCRGSAVDNQYLSEKRVNTIVNYLELNGVIKQRLIAIGYGETRLINGCRDDMPCADKEHKANNRIEFKIF